jgi:phytoene dehydrogenase-like protein
MVNLWNRTEKIVVIGAGIAGLHIGAILSQYAPVLVLEKTRTLGGRARVIENDGFLLDYGGHPVRHGDNSPLAESLKELGISVNFIKPGPVQVLLKDGTLALYPSGVKSILKSKLVPKMELIKVLWRIIKMGEDDLRKLYEVSLSEWMKTNKVSSAVERYLRLVAASVMVCPFVDRLSAGETFESMGSILKKGSVFYPDGGWTSFFNPLIEKIKKSGGDVQIGQEVQSIVVSNNKIIGVKVNNKLIKAKFVVSTIPVQKLFTILDPKLTDSSFVEKCMHLKPTAGIAIDICVSKRITDLKGILLIEDPPGFGFSPSNLSPEVGPSGKQWLSFFTPTELEIIKDTDKRKELYQYFKQKIFEFLPNLEENIEFERPLFLEMVDGVEVNINQHRLLRPGHTVPKIEGLWLAGDSVGGEGAGGDVGHTSVRECFELIKKNYDYKE